MKKTYILLLAILIILVLSYAFVKTIGSSTDSEKEKVTVEEKKVEVKVEKKKIEKKKIEKSERENHTQSIAVNGKVIDIIIPTPPKVTVVSTNGENDSLTDRSIKFSKRVPANYITSAERYAKHPKTTVDKNAPVKIIGLVDKGRISAYLRGDLMDVKTASDKLKNAGFDVLVAEPLNKEKTLVSIVFTSAELKKMASKTDRGYMATLRLLIDPKNKQISITNPLYVAKAFMQDEFDDTIPKKILESISKEFSGLRNSLDKLKFQLLPKYQFMFGMPYYEDMETVAKGSNLVEKLKKDKIVFQLKLDNGAVLVGVKLSENTSSFTNKIGTNNAAMLPYPILIENGEAKVLEPKYYLSLMYPQLAMEQFMTISSVPDEIVDECEKVFK